MFSSSWARPLLQVGYVGAKGTKLFRFRDINQPSQAQITAFDTSRLSAPGRSFPTVRSPDSTVQMA